MKKLVVVAFCFLITSEACTKKKATPQPVGTAVSYTCDLSKLGDLSNGFGKRKIYFSEVERREKTLYLLVSDDRFSTSDAAILFIVDTEKNRVDQIRTRDGAAFQTSLKQSLVTPDQALAYVHSKVGLVLVEGVAQAMTNSVGNSSATASTVDFSFDGKAYTSSTAMLEATGFSLKTMSTRVDLNKETFCSYDAPATVK